MGQVSRTPRDAKRTQGRSTSVAIPGVGQILDRVRRRPLTWTTQTGSAGPGLTGSWSSTDVEPLGGRGYMEVVGDLPDAPVGVYLVIATGTFSWGATSPGIVQGDTLEVSVGPKSIPLKIPANPTGDAGSVSVQCQSIREGISASAFITVDDDATGLTISLDIEAFRIGETGAIES